MNNMTLEQDIPPQLTSSAKWMCVTTLTPAYLCLITAKINHTPIFWKSEILGRA